MSVGAAPSRSVPYWRRGRTLDGPADMMALLLWAPRSIPEVVSLTGMQRDRVVNWFKHLHDAGVIRVAGKRPPDGTPGNRPLVYEMQVRPFEIEDTPEEVCPL